MSHKNIFDELKYEIKLKTFKELFAFILLYNTLPQTRYQSDIWINKKLFVVTLH